MAQPPVWVGDPEAVALIEGTVEAALEATAAFGPWPSTPWRVQLHPDAPSFERATGAPPQRAGAWVGSTLHLRPWDQLRRRDVGSLLRHELTHRRLGASGLRRWEEEARCVWAETHVRPPAAWPEAPASDLQERLDLAIARGTTESQAWAYRWLRAWLEARPTPPPPPMPPPRETGWDAWNPEGERPVPSSGTVRVQWPSERLPSRLVINGEDVPRKKGAVRLFLGQMRFGPDHPMTALEGRCEVQWTGSGWNLTWVTDPATWVAAAVAGEMGQAPFEAKRALAAVLARWLEGHQKHQHPDGVLCPLTHCAVVRGMPGNEDRKAAGTAPRLDIDARWVFFTGSTGGEALSVREVWGNGPEFRGAFPHVEGDPWGTWERTLTAHQVERLKATVRPGLASGQKGLMLGRSGPYAVEALRLAAGRQFGWTTWPSNACECEPLSGGGIRLRGHGWGHNAGLCLASAIHWAKLGWSAEQILEAAFGTETPTATDPGTPPR